MTDNLDPMVSRYLKASLRVHGIDVSDLDISEMLDVACMLPKPKTTIEEWLARMNGDDQAVTSEITEEEKLKANDAGLSFLKLLSDSGMMSNNLVSISDVKEKSA